MGDTGEVLTTLKLLIIGESGVGKSSLLLRFTDDAFDPEQAATIVSNISKSKVCRSEFATFYICIYAKLGNLQV